MGFWRRYMGIFKVPWHCMSVSVLSTLIEFWVELYLAIYPGLTPSLGL